jgi:hypothetical protein
LRKSNASGLGTTLEQAGFCRDLTEVFANHACTAMEKMAEDRPSVAMLAMASVRCHQANFFQVIEKALTEYCPAA